MRCLEAAHARANRFGQVIGERRLGAVGNSTECSIDRRRLLWLQQLLGECVVPAAPKLGAFRTSCSPIAVGRR